MTTLAGASGGITMLAWGHYLFGHWDLPLALNGILAGMICSCGGVNVYDVPYALIVGFTGAFAYYGQEWVTINIFHIDDPLSAAALHMGAGFWGVILAWLLANENFAGEGMGGAFTHGNWDQLGWQIAAVLVYFAWAFATSTILFFTLNVLGMFRVSEEEEMDGLDKSHHGGAAYNNEVQKIDTNSERNSEKVDAKDN